MKMNSYINGKFKGIVEIDMDNFNASVHKVFLTNTFVFTNMPKETRISQNVTNFSELNLEEIFEQDVLVITNYHSKGTASEFLIKDLYQMYKQISKKNLHYLVEQEI